MSEGACPVSVVFGRNGQRVNDEDKGGRLGGMSEPKSMDTFTFPPVFLWYDDDTTDCGPT